MRSFTDINGISIRPEEVRGDDAYAGMLEGTPYLARKFRLISGREQMERRVAFVHGLDELEKELAVTPRDASTWAPNERWTARLVGLPDWEKKTRQYLYFTWYQEGGDPMNRLKELISTLDFGHYCLEEAFDDT